MENIVERSLLFDIYGPLLTEHQRSIYSDVVDNDYSLSEIGEELGISRQGVHDTIKRIDKILTDYEDKLHFAETYLKNMDTIGKIKEEVSIIESSGTDCNRIKTLLNELTEDL
ncbi:MAG: YlxM family DNA-binding protein [Lachnospiraceae bacterium]|nr:YlxM family DNA-binding protein [Lachnospiraceae bacterium]